MMFVNIAVSPGEFDDRQSILRLKLERITDPAVRKIAEVELNDLRLQIIAAPQPDREAYKKLRDELYECNARLWTVEDELRLLDQHVFDIGGRPVATSGVNDTTMARDYATKYMQLARSVYQLNAKRTQLKAEINAIFGTPPEAKQYANVPATTRVSPAELEAQSITIAQQLLGLPLDQQERELQLLDQTNRLLAVLVKNQLGKLRS